MGKGRDAAAKLEAAMTAQLAKRPQILSSRILAWLVRAWARAGLRHMPPGA
jgi:hypothetical protein